MRDLISAIRSRAISASRLLSRSLLTKVTVSSMAWRVRSAMFRSRKRTCSAIGFRRWPSQVSQVCARPSCHSFQAFSSPLCSSSKPSSARPVPKQPSHQPCLELNENRRGSSSRETRAAGRAGALDGEHLHFWLLRAGVEVQHVQQALADVERADHVALDAASALSFCTLICVTGSSMVCSLNAIEPRPLLGRDHFAVDAQVFVAARIGPFRELGVVTLARDHERREQQDARALVLLEQSLGDGRGSLRLDGARRRWGRTACRASRRAGAGSDRSR